MSEASAKQACGGVGTVLWTVAKVILMAVVLYNVYGFVWLLLTLAMEGATHDIFSSLNLLAITPAAVAAAITHPIAIVICFVTVGYLWRSQSPWLPASAALIAVLGMACTINALKDVFMTMGATDTAGYASPPGMISPLNGAAAFSQLAANIVWLSIPLGPLSVFMGRALWTMRRDRSRAVADKPARSGGKKPPWQKWGIILISIVLVIAIIYIATANVISGHQPPPYEAAVADNPVTAPALVDHGAEDVSATDKDGMTALHWAAYAGNLETAQSLINRGADVRATDNLGRTPLHEIAHSDSLGIAKLLIEHGADVKATDKQGVTPLYWVASSGKPEVAKLLIEHGADAKATDQRGSTPLHEAARSGNLEMTELLIEHGANASAIDDQGVTPLFSAAGSGKPEVVKLLIEHGADAKATDSGDETPLHWAANYGSLEVAKLLAEHGADVNAKHSGGATPLHMAAASGKPEVAKLLIEHGADVNAIMTANGLTPLHGAAAYGYTEAAKLLLAHGADINVKDNKGFTALHWAESGNHQAVAELLRQHGAKE